MILYHGSPNREFVPEYGKGEVKHDYGRGFYLTADVILAREWAVCNPGGGNGWVHKYCLAWTVMMWFGAGGRMRRIFILQRHL